MQVEQMLEIKGQCCMFGDSEVGLPLLCYRIVLCSGHKAPLVTYSVLKYHKENQEAGQEGMR